MKYVDQWFAVYLWRPNDQAKIEIQSQAPESFCKDEMVAESNVLKRFVFPVKLFWKNSSNVSGVV